MSVMHNTRVRKIIVGGMLGVVVVFSVYTFIWYTLIPFSQLATFYSKMHRAFAGREESFEKDSFVFSPMTFAQGLIRYNFVNTMLEQYKAGRVTRVHPLLLVSIERLQEYVEREPYFPNYYFLLGRATDLLADLNNNNITLLEQAGKYYEAGLALNPYRQDGRYAYAINLMNQGREEESQKIIRETLAENHAVPESHYYVGVLELKRKKPDHVFALYEIEKALTAGANPDPKLTNRVYDIFFNYFYNKKDKENFITVLERKKIFDPKQTAIYDAIIFEITTKGRIPIIDLVQPR